MLVPYIFVHVGVDLAEQVRKELLAGNDEVSEALGSRQRPPRDERSHDEILGARGIVIEARTDHQVRAPVLTEAVVQRRDGPDLHVVRAGTGARWEEQKGSESTG